MLARAMMTSRSWLLRTMSWSMAHIVTKGHMDAHDLGHHLWSCWFLRAVPLPNPYRPVPIKGRADAYDLGYHLGPCGCLRPCCTWVHADLNDLHCQPGLWCHLGPCCCQEPCLGPWSNCSWVCVNIHGPYCHQGLHGCQDSGPPPRAMSVSEG